MPHLTYLSDAKTIEVDTATSILHASLQNGIAHTHVCGGNAKCSTCRVLILDGLDQCCPRNEKEQKMADRRHFSPNVRLACQTTLTGDATVRRLVLDNEDIQLVDQEITGTTPRSVGEERPLAILFSDIRNFTAFSEAHLPYDVVHLLNRYFLRVGAVITEHHGQIDNFIGDGLMALFGVGDDDPHPVLSAIRAGLGMLTVVEELRPYVDAQFKFDFRIGVGIHYGEAVLGVVGAGERRRLTAIGDSVNFASRIESANKEAKTELLISEEAYAQVQHAVQLGRHVELPIKGKTGKYWLHEIVGLAAPGAMAEASGHNHDPQPG